MRHWRAGRLHRLLATLRGQTLEHARKQQPKQVLENAIQHPTCQALTSKLFCHSCAAYALELHQADRWACYKTATPHCTARLEQHWHKCYDEQQLLPSSTIMPCTKHAEQDYTPFC